MEFFGKDAGLRTFIGNLQKRMKSVGSSFMRVGSGIAGAGLAQLTPMIAAVGTLQDMAKLKAVGDAFGMTEEAASGLFGMLAMNGGEFKEDMEGITQFSTRISDALNGVGGATGEAAKLFEGLSVSAKDLVGLPIDEQFFRVHAAIRELPQGLQTSRLALIGGTDSLKKWLPLLSRSTDELRAQAKAASVSGADLQEAREATDAYLMATVQLTQVWRKVAVAVAPTVQLISEMATKWLRPLAEVVDQNRVLIVSFVAVAAASVALGVAFIGIGAAISALGTILGGIVTVVSALASPLGIAAIAVAALAAGFVYLTGVGSTLVGTFRGVVDALSLGDLGLAWKIGLAGLELEWARLVEVLTVAWNDFKSFFVDGWHSAVYLIEQAWLGAGASFTKTAGMMMMGGSKLVDGLADLFAGLARSVSASFQMIVSVVRDQLLRVMRVAEVALGGTGALIPAQILKDAQTVIRAQTFGARTLETGIAAARQEAAGLSKEMRDAGIGMLGADATAKQLEAHKRFQKEQAAREASRQGDAMGARARTQAVETFLGAAIAEAHMRAKNKQLGAAIMASMAGSAGAAAPPGLAAAMGAVRGQFAGFGSLSASLGGSGPTREVTKRLDKLVEKTDDEIEVMQEVVRNTSNFSGGVVWGV